MKCKFYLRRWWNDATYRHSEHRQIRFLFSWCSEWAADGRKLRGSVVFGNIQGESKKTGISKILNFVWGPLKCTKLNFNPMHIFSPLRDIWFNGITMDFSFKNEWVIVIWKFWDPSFFWLTLYIYEPRLSFMLNETKNHGRELRTKSIHQAITLKWTELAGWWPMGSDIFKHNVSVMLELMGHFVKTLIKNSDQW